MTEVRLRACPDYEMDHCRAAVLAACGDLSWVRPGMKIGIKANLVAAAAPEKAATTHPALLTALTELLTERGAVVVIGDSPGGLYTPAFLQHIYKVCGLDQIPGAVLNTDCAVAQARFPQGAVLHQFTYTAWLDGCDALINFAKLKTHGMMALTAAVKNFFGAIPGAMKPEYHFRFPNAEDFAAMLTDLQWYFKPRLHLVDGVTAMEGNGPTAGTPRHLGVVLGSEDPFALDEVCAALIGLDPADVPTQEAARRLGRVPEFAVTGGAAADYCLPDFRVPPRGSTLFRTVLPGKAGVLFGRLAQAALAPRPTLTPSKCIGCGKCAAICPAKAITLVHKKPKFRRKVCIGCFCCQEFCPAGALAAQRTRLARLLSP